MLRLVANNLPSPSVLPQQPMFLMSNSRASFSAETLIAGPNLYTMTAQNPSQHLETELVIEIEGNHEEFEDVVINCQFPKINEDSLLAFVDGDDTLFGILMIQFQMKILDQLLLFASNHYASKLTIFADIEQAEHLGIYQEFIMNLGESNSLRNDGTILTIHLNPRTMEEWADFMGGANLKFGQTLWKDQRSNPTIRQYLKSYSLN